jgi:hypothetical protein
MKEKYITDVIFAKFNMYRHYLRKINKKENYEWLRNIFHRIGQ